MLSEAFESLSRAHNTCQRSIEACYKVIQLFERGETMHKHLRGKGFTLIEMMIVVAIIAIIAAIAYPSYRDSVMRSNRSEGRALVIDLAQQLERCMTMYGSYNSADCNIANASKHDSSHGFYTVTVTSDETTYSLSAAVKGGQSDDKDCASLVYNNIGQKSAKTSTGTDTTKCW